MALWLNKVTRRREEAEAVGIFNVTLSWKKEPRKREFKGVAFLHIVSDNLKHHSVEKEAW